MPWNNNSALLNNSNRLAADVARIEVKLDAAISQAAADRSITQAHIAECNLRNKHADEEENNAKREWMDFKAAVFGEIVELSNKVGKTQYRLGMVIALMGGAAWALDHFHLLTWRIE